MWTLVSFNFSRLLIISFSLASHKKIETFTNWIICFGAFTFLFGCASFPILVEDNGLCSNLINWSQIVNNTYNYIGFVGLCIGMIIYTVISVFMLPFVGILTILKLIQIRLKSRKLVYSAFTSQNSKINTGDIKLVISQLMASLHACCFITP